MYDFFPNLPSDAVSSTHTAFAQDIVAEPTDRDDFLASVKDADTLPPPDDDCLYLPKGSGCGVNVYNPVGDVGDMNCEHAAPGVHGAAANEASQSLTNHDHDNWAGYWQDTLSPEDNVIPAGVPVDPSQFDPALFDDPAVQEEFKEFHDFLAKMNAQITADIETGRLGRRMSRYMSSNNPELLRNPAVRKELFQYADNVAAKIDADARAGAQVVQDEPKGPSDEAQLRAPITDELADAAKARARFAEDMAAGERARARMAKIMAADAAGSASDHAHHLPPSGNELGVVTSGIHVDLSVLKTLRTGVLFAGGMLSKCFGIGLMGYLAFQSMQANATMNKQAQAQQQQTRPQPQLQPGVYQQRTAA